MGFGRLAVDVVTGAYVFPGQGSQRVGMGGDLLVDPGASLDLFERASAALGADLLAILRDGPEERLRRTEFAQPAIFTVGLALAERARAVVEPVASAGHSFAEFCSLTLAGALDVDTALALVVERGRAMAAAAGATPGSMAAILGLDETALRAVIARVRANGGLVTLANFNAPEQIVISGEAGAVARAGVLATEAGARRVVPLNVSGAWHSELMAPARERFAEVLAGVEIRSPRFPVISNVDAEPYRDVETIRENLARSVTDEVLWHRTSVRLLEERADVVVECGGSSVLAALMKRLPGVRAIGKVTEPVEIDALRSLA